MPAYSIIKEKKRYYKAFAGLLADLHSLIKKQHLQNYSTNKSVKLLKETNLIWFNLLGNKVKTDKDIDKIKEKYNSTKNYISTQKLNIKKKDSHT